MKPSLRSRHARLLALCGLSAAVHLALLHGFATYLPARTEPDAGPAGPLRVRLAPPAAAVAAVAIPQPAPATSPAARAATDAGQARATAKENARSAAAPRPVAPQAPAPSPATAEPSEAAAVTDAPAPAAPPMRPGTSLPGATDPAPSDAAPPPPARVARRYRTDIPKARRIAYAIVPDGAALHPDAAPSAYLDWRPDGDRYALEMDGVLGRLSSSGVIGDDGLAPARADARTGEGDAVVRFDAEGRSIAPDGGTAAPGAAGLQDAASALLRLASIGLGDATQLRGAVAVQLADAAGVRVDSYEVIGQEEVVTGRGKVTALHLAQRAAPGQVRLELWLAPEYDWLPVRLRLIRPDGSGAVQVMLRAESDRPN